MVATNRATAQSVELPRQTTGTRRRELLEIAAELFARNGYHGTSIREIAKRANMNGASLYHYFRSKNEALLLVCQAGISNEIKFLAQQMERPAPTGERIRALIANHIEDMAVHADYRAVYIEQRRYLTPEQVEILGERSREYRTLLDRLFEEARAQNELRPEISVRYASLTMVAAFRSLLQFYTGGPMRDYADFARHLTDTLIRGMLVDPEPPRP